LDEAERKGGKQLMKILAMGRCLTKKQKINKKIVFQKLFKNFSESLSTKKAAKTTT
jgi:hypothetical protein